MAAAAVLITAAFDVALLPALGGPLSQANLTLAVSLFLLVIVSRSLAMLFYLTSTMLIALTSSSMFFLPLMTGLAVLFIVDALFERVFTNRSIYTVVTLGVTGWLMYYLVFALLSLLLRFTPSASFSFVHTAEWWIYLLYNLFGLAALYSLGYLAVSFTSKRFRSYFIVTHPYGR